MPIQLKDNESLCHKVKETGELLNKAIGYLEKLENLLTYADPIKVEHPDIKCLRDEIDYNRSKAETINLKIEIIAGILGGDF